MVPGTEGAQGATFSPDGDWIAYSTTESALFKVSLSGGAPNLLVRAGTSGTLSETGLFAPHWGDDGTIVFANTRSSFRVPDTGGGYVPLRQSEPFSHPYLLPGGWAVLGSRIGGGVILMDLEADTIRELAAIGFDPEYVETGHILYVDASGGLWSLPFDAADGRVLGDAVPVLDGVNTPAPYTGFLFPRFSVSRNGTLVYGAGGGAGGGPGAQRRLLVVDLEGNEEAVPLDPRPLRATRWSPDGESVAYDGTEPGASAVQRDIYTYSVALRTAPRRLTFDGDSRWPVWSPDGTRIAFASRGTARFDLYVKRVDDDSPPQMIVTLPGSEWPTHWPSDDLLLFERGSDLTPTDLWMVDLSADSAVASPYLESEADLLNPMISPDRDLVAYTSDESGTVEVYVRSFPEARQPEIVSRGGGQFPSWSPDGNTIYYWTPGLNTSPKSLIAAMIERGPPFVVISRDTTMITGIFPTLYWDLHPDGDRLVIPQDVIAPGGDTAADEAPEPERFIVVTNWFEELRQRMGN